jgi:hypothetical protein
MATANVFRTAVAGFMTASALCFGVFGAVAQAQILDPKLKQQEAEKSLAEDQLAAANMACGTGLSARFDWPTFDMKQAENFSVQAYCGEPLTALKGICGTEQGRQSVAAKVKGFVCKQGKERKLNLTSDGMLEYSVDYSSVNDFEYVSTWLKKNI